MKVKWTRKAKLSLDSYYNFIALDSPKNAKRVKKKIVLTTRTLSNNPYLYQIDEYYPNNNGSIRRFFEWNYRVVYQIRSTEIIILNIFHTNLNPNNY